MTSPLPRLHLTDLLRQAKENTAFQVRGRRRELSRLAYTLGRASQHNLLVSGPRGVGKTALVQAFSQSLLTNKFAALRPLPYLALNTTQAASLLHDAQKKDRLISHLATALRHLPDCVLVIDDADILLSSFSETWHFDEVFSPFYESTRCHLILVLSPARLEMLHRTNDTVAKYFDTLEVTELSTAVCEEIVTDHAAALSQRYGITVDTAVIPAVMRAAHANTITALPRRALHVLDEACAACVIRKDTAVTAAHVAHIRAQRLGLPEQHLSQQNTAILRRLEMTLKQRVRGQEHAVQLVANTVRRGWLGLKNPQRPVGSFLFLGPSGVGKTELAKVLAEEVYGSSTAFIRFDMSEFSEPHTAQRLLGAPPGYVGYEAGGQLTNAVRQQPFSLILLDEIEKAHVSVFDMFLQLLDDGRLTDGQGQLVDFTNTIVIATSNIGTQEIIAAAGDETALITTPQFFDRVVMPLLLRRFRPEFLNRFDHLVTFNPLTLEILLDIAGQEVKKIEQRLAAHHIKIHLDPTMLRQKITELYDPRFGARPLKRYLEATCEDILAERLLRV